ncbi:MAG: 2,3-bisphosphoglycerate-dependent phosphoglycerate mutase [Chroococcidiopsis sp. SAG 2025]|uniref:histidine phosphatase family protein n=1 Tax=Chroococcidiopsis sp. SAG 2025 TaxID=171389 RepID=UPI0029371C90|nr:histidine phosphatase family protein [Chroococcidiopsis sp. SAG 2025]MDV2990477.1 2,3-bisphosphoglycerate-dependent phosphoglycerate mutase [Chroococcidiopsis sp. SAG 2025]
MRWKHEEDRATRVILVRHGQSTYNALGLYQGSSDESVLTEVGRTDARLTGDFLKGVVFDAIYSSSLKRAQETAQEILRVISSLAQLRLTNKLRETNLPAWQGLSFQYVRENFAKEYRLWKQHPHLFEMELHAVGEIVRRQGGQGRQGSSVASALIVNQQPTTNSQQLDKFFPALDLYQRVREFWQEILPRHRGQTVLLVTHGGTNRALISTALGITPDRYHCIQQSNCGISVLNFPDGSLESGQLEAMNLNTHVGEHLPKPQEGGKGLRLLLVPSGTNAAQTQNIARFLKQVRIDFSLNSILDSYHITVQQILQYHPETVQFEVLREDIPEAWQAVIGRRSRANSQQLTTGLVMTSEETIARLIGHVFNMNSDVSERILVKKGTISCLQYPGDRHPPILQAMNILTTQNDLIHKSDVGWEMPAKINF